MKSEIKKQWIAALKSGKYKQGKNRLISGNQKGTYHCCLGVLSELAVEAGVCSRKQAFEGNATLTTKVKEWAGTVQTNPRLFCGNVCSDLNDNLGLTFKQIAGKIARTRAEKI